ncbi:hypothetical protein GCM10009557_19000 [Virgisporangium ochraceum]
MNDDQARAHRERSARERLVAVGPGRLDPRPWQPPPVPPSATDLVHAFLWWSGRTPAADPGQRDGAVAALELLAAARAEVDQLEASLLFTARALELTWAEMARAMGLNSPQACQQRLDRLQNRVHGS